MKLKESRRRIGAGGGELAGRFDEMADDRVAVGEGGNRLVDGLGGSGQGCRGFARQVFRLGQHSERCRQRVEHRCFGLYAVSGEQQVQRPARLRHIRPMPHTLRGVIVARPFADAVIFRACRGLAAGCVHKNGGIRRRHFVVVGIAAARPCRQVIFRHLPGAHAFLEMFGKSFGVSSEPYRRFGGAGHGAVVAMLAGDIEEGRDDDIGPFAAVGAHQPLDCAHLAPAGKGLVAIL